MIGAVDIGGTKIAVGAVGEDGAVLARREFPSDPARDASAAVPRICALLRAAAVEAGGELRGIGIGSTGPVDPFTGLYGRVDFLPLWEGLNLPAELSRAFGLTAAIENDADAAALAEAAWGAGRGAGRFIYVTVSTGIGGGIVIDGQLYRGAGGTHPEVGHHVIDLAGPRCSCGARGCWESLAAGPAFARLAGFPSAREVCAAAERGEAGARAAVEAEGRYLGIGLSNLITLFAPEVIALGGGVMASRHLFWDTLLATIRQTCGLMPYELTRILPAALGGEAALIGAARVWLHRYGVT
jgi:glucokinase